MSQLDFMDPAELFFRTRRRRWMKELMTYRRFDNLALAVQFAIEQAENDLNDVIIQTEAEEFTGTSIRSLYDNTEYPFARR
jgi:hypothetical protein